MVNINGPSQIGEPVKRDGRIHVLPPCSIILLRLSWVKKTLSKTGHLFKTFTIQ